MHASHHYKLPSVWPFATPALRKYTANLALQNRAARNALRFWAASCANLPSAAVGIRGCCSFYSCSLAHTVLQRALLHVCFCTAGSPEIHRNGLTTKLDELAINDMGGAVLCPAGVQRLLRVELRMATSKRCVLGNSAIHQYKLPSEFRLT